LEQLTSDIRTLSGLVAVVKSGIQISKKSPPTTPRPYHCVVVIVHNHPSQQGRSRPGNRRIESNCQRQQRQQKLADR
jgi:hypothetical protein